jgi:hypothetical protein
MPSALLPWLRITAEAVLVFVSILAALAADAWWDERQERVAEGAALENLRAEANSNLQELATKTAGHRRSEQAAVRLIRVIDGDVPLFSEPIDSLLWAVFLDASTFEARTGALDGLLSAGQLDIIRSPELRAQLASWRAQLDDTSEEDAWIVNDIRTLLRPYLVENALVRPAERVYDSFRDIGPGARAYDFQSIVEDREFESLVLLRLEDERITLDAYDDLRDATENMLELIETELGR